jgi:hypothetical protein
MKTMGSRLMLIAAITLGGFAACNETVGECWYYGEGTENAGVGPGGGVLIPTGPAGVGGYGEGPPKEPLDATRPPPPECNIVSLSPCHDKCDTEDQARAIECAKIQDEAQRRACIDGSIDKFKSCNKECENTPKDTCQEKWERCTHYAPYLTCASPGSGSGGKTRCRLCWEECEAGKPVSPICKKCLF